MPSWGIHIATANILLNKLNIPNNQQDSFLLGNLLPDIKNGYIITPEHLTNVLEHNKTHFSNPMDYVNTTRFSDKSLERFLEEYKTKLNNPVVLGYFTHLLTDFYWNEYTFTNHYILNTNGEVVGAILTNNQEVECSKKESRSFKHKDFKYFGYLLCKELKVEVPEKNVNILKDCCEISEISINEKELDFTIEYLKDMRKKIQLPLEQYQYQMFDEKEFKNVFEKNIEFIMKYIAQERKI